MQNLGDGCQAVGCAGSVRNHVMVRRDRKSCRSRQDERGIRSISSRGDDHFLHRRAQMLFGVWALGEKAGRFDDNIRANAGPVNFRGLHLEHFDGLALDADGILGVVIVCGRCRRRSRYFKRSGERFGIGDHVDGDELNVLVVKRSAHDVATNAAEAVNPTLIGILPPVRLRRLRRHNRFKTPREEQKCSWTIVKSQRGTKRHPSHGRESTSLCQLRAKQPKKKRPIPRGPLSYMDEHSKFDSCAFLRESILLRIFVDELTYCPANPRRLFLSGRVAIDPSSCRSLPHHAREPYDRASASAATTRRGSSPAQGGDTVIAFLHFPRGSVSIHCTAAEYTPPKIEKSAKAASSDRQVRGREHSLEVAGIDRCHQHQSECLAAPDYRAFPSCWLVARHQGLVPT